MSNPRPDLMAVALELCDHDMCTCGEINTRGQIIGGDVPADYPPCPQKEAKRAELLRLYNPTEREGAR